MEWRKRLGWTVPNNQSELKTKKVLSFHIFFQARSKARVGAKEEEEMMKKTKDEDQEEEEDEEIYSSIMVSFTVQQLLLKLYRSH